MCFDFFRLFVCWFDLFFWCIHADYIMLYFFSIDCLIVVKCRLWDYFFFCSQVGWHMSCLKTPNRERQCLPHTRPHCIKCLSYSPHPIIQMSGFWHTSKGNFDSLCIFEFSTLLMRYMNKFISAKLPM